MLFTINVYDMNVLSRDNDIDYSVDYLSIFN